MKKDMNVIIKFDLINLNLKHKFQTLQILYLQLHECKIVRFVFYNGNMV